jgi:hypothetical protein
MTIRVLKSSDASAPELSGTVGSLKSLLQAALVDGYGSSTPLGWSVAYTDAPSNTIAILQGGSSPIYLQLADGAPGAAGAREARAAGYQTMSDALTGTGKFPSSGLSAGAYVVRKSSALDSLPRDWLIAGDTRRFILATKPADLAGMWSIFFFGDTKSYRASDDYKALISGRSVENDPATYTVTSEWLIQINALTSFATTGHMQRNFSGATASKSVNFIADNAKAKQTGQYAAGSVGLPYPDPIGGALWFSKIWIGEDQQLRGEVPGLWIPLHTRPLGDGDTFTATPETPARSFIALDTAGYGQILIETSDTWDI